VFAAVLIAVSGKAQITADIGVWGGSSVCFGDLRENNVLSPLNLNFGGYFRYNFNSRVALRAQFLTGKFSDEGNIQGVDTAFSKNVQDLSFMVEVNYLKYILGVENAHYSSYVLFGVGVSYFPYQMDPAFIDKFNPNNNKGSNPIDESVMTPTIPFGIGFKYTIGQRLGIGVEYQMRKMFSDKLDNLDDPMAYLGDPDADGNRPEIKPEIKYTDAVHNNDWSGYLGVHITYKIYTGKRACPAYESKN